jgi:hypothetical protein
MTSNKPVRKLSLNQETLKRLTETHGNDLFQPTTTVLSNFVTCKCVIAE